MGQLRATREPLPSERETARPHFGYRQNVAGRSSFGAIKKLPSGSVRAWYVPHSRQQSVRVMNETRADGACVGRLLRGGRQTGEHRGRKCCGGSPGLLDRARHELIVETEKSEQQMAGCHPIVVKFDRDPQRLLEGSFCIGREMRLAAAD